MIMDMAARRAANTWMPNIHMFGEGFFVDVKAYIEDAQVTVPLAESSYLGRGLNLAKIAGTQGSSFVGKSMQVD